MISKRLLVYAALAAFLLVGAYLVFGSSKERRVLRVLREMAGAMSSMPGDTQAGKARRIQRACQKHLGDSFVLVAPEVGTVEGADAIADLSLFGSDLGLQVEIKESDVRVGKGTHARASLLVEITSRPTGEERHERRNVAVELNERDGDYRIDRVEVTDASKEEPEPRP